jgi:hypothetical protein
MLHNASWKTDALATTVQIPQAVLHLNGGASTWDPVAFVYGPLSGTARVLIPVCEPDQQCLPTVSVDFPALDARELETTLLGSQQKGTLLSTVLSQLTSSSDHKWPAFHGVLKAETFALGAVTLANATADLKVSPAEAELTSIDAELLGGQVHLTGKIENGEKPSYSLEGQVQRVSPAELCRVLELECSGQGIDGSGSVQFAGFTASDIASSAKGSLHFEWKKGAINGHVSGGADSVPTVLTRFDEWSSGADIADNGITLKDSSIRTGKRVTAVKAAITFGEPPKVVFGAAKAPNPKK